MKEKMNMIFIEVKNTYDSHFIKESRDGHGYGLKIIEDIIKLYQGDISIQKDDNHYQIIICLYEKVGDYDD